MLLGLGNCGVGVACRGTAQISISLHQCAWGHPVVQMYLGTLEVGLRAADGRAMLCPRHLFMDSGPSTLHLMILADPKTPLHKALVPYKHAMCDTTQPISDTPGVHSRGCGYLLQACAQTCSSATTTLPLLPPPTPLP